MTSTDVYVLGAGFSRAVGREMPLLPDLGTHVLKHLGQDPAVLDSFGGNLEAWLSHLADEQPWLPKAENLRNRARFLDASTAINDAIAGLERDVVRNHMPMEIARFASHVSQSRSNVITLNYDLLLERAAIYTGSSNQCAHMYVAPLEKRRGQSTGGVLGSSKSENPEMRLYKLHGSINWFYAGPEDSGGGGLYMRDNHVTWSTSPYVDPDEEREILYGDLVPLIIPPTASKDSFYRNEGLRTQWRKAAIALQKAHRLIIIGYSFPPTDLQTRALFTTNLDQSAKLVVVDRSQDTVDRIAAVFGGAKMDATFLGEDAFPRFVENECSDYIEWDMVDQDQSQLKGRIRVNREPEEVTPVLNPNWPTHPPSPWELLRKMLEDRWPGILDRARSLPEDPPGHRYFALYPRSV